MLLRILSFLLGVIYLTQGFNVPTNSKIWNFEFISLETTTSDENLLKFDLELEQIARATLGMTGELVVNYDIVDGDNNMIEVLVYRSATGSSEYKLTPFTVNKQHLHMFFNTFYKEMIMDSLSKCSNFPSFEDKFQPPFGMNTYTLKDCVVTNEGMPPYMSEGFYKVIVKGSGTVDYKIEVIAKVENDT